MPQRLLKVEILLPKYYNDKTKIEAKKYRITYQEIYRQFKGYSKSESIIQGYWIDPNTNKRYREENLTFWVMCEDTTENTAFLVNLKETLKVRFNQEDIMMYYSHVYRF